MEKDLAEESRNKFKVCTASRKQLELIFCIQEFSGGEKVGSR